MKNLKTKLLAAIAMLAVSAICLTSATFAWFTLSTNPEIANVEANVTANGNLEIAAGNGTIAASAVGDSGVNTKWGNLIDLTGFADADITLKPCDVDETNGTVKIPTFGLDGRVKALTTATATAATGTGLEGVYYYEDTNNDIFAIRIDFNMRSNVAGTVSLLSASGTDRGANEEGLGSFMKSAKADGSADNTQASKITVALQVANGALQKATYNSTDGSLELDDFITLVANEAQVVHMYIYMDGADLTNADFANEEYSLKINVQFAHSETLVPMDLDGTENGRTDAAAGK